MAGWKSVDEIRAYTLSLELRDAILSRTESGPAKDFTYRNQIRESSASAPANLAEGFDRYGHGGFGYLAKVAKASLAETITHLKDPRAETYFKEERPRLLKIAEEARKTTGGLINYLERSQAPGESPTRKRPR